MFGQPRNIPCKVLPLAPRIYLWVASLVLRRGIVWPTSLHGATAFVVLLNLSCSGSFLEIVWLAAAQGLALHLMEQVQDHCH